MELPSATLLEQAKVFHRQGNLAEAAVRYRRVLADRPGEADALYGLAVIACQQGRFDEGIGLVSRALAAEPGHARAHNLMGTALSRLGRSAEALASFDRATACRPDFAEAHGNRGNALSALGRHAEALASYDRAVALDPNSVMDWYNRGAALEDIGRLSDALMSYERALAVAPDQAEAQLARASLLLRIGSSGEALAGFERARALNPSDPEALFGCARALSVLDRAGEALARFGETLAIAPDHAGALAGSGDALLSLGRHRDAIERYDRAIAIKPDHLATLNNRGNALSALGRHEEALASYDRALALAPSQVATMLNRSGVLMKLQRPAEAAVGYDQVLAVEPGHIEALIQRGHALDALNRFDEALESYERAVAASPVDVGALLGRAGALLKLDRPDDALATVDCALALQPGHAGALDSRSMALLELGRVGEAVASLRRAVEIKPTPATHTGLIFTLNFDPAATTAELQAERRRWNELHARPLAGEITPHPNVRDAGRRLRIGYVSAHFRHQAGTYAFGGVILNHDPSASEVVCYSDTAIEDDVTALIRARADLWHDTAALSDDDLAGLIRRDGIDILVDTVGHMSGNRLLVMARKPAPIQVTAWGEPTGTGLTAIDYLLSDPVLVPQIERQFFAERIFDLPNFLGFWTPSPLPDVAPPPCLTSGHVTFGSFNRMVKIQEPVLRTWAAILRALPSARLLVKTDQLLADDSRRTRVDRVLREEGVASERVRLFGRTDRATHLATYGQIDLALDPFPHGGGMTTLDALSMGLPVITCPGRTLSSRLAAASLTALGLNDFIAADTDDYVRLAVAKAADIDGLARLRAGLRGRLAASGFGDSKRYATAVEAAYRTMWRRWCEAN